MPRDVSDGADDADARHRAAHRPRRARVRTADVAGPCALVAAALLRRRRRRRRRRRWGLPPLQGGAT